MSRASAVHFRASRYILGLKHAPESKVMANWICQGLPCSISNVSIYFAPELDIQVKSTDHLNFSRAFVVYFRASRYIMGLTHILESKVMAVWICRELPCSISSVSIYYVPESEVRYEKLWPFELLESFCCSFFERLDISRASHIHLSQKFGLFEFPESFRIQFLVSRYIMRRHRTSDWKVMTIWISRELLVFIFERLDISWASHINSSQKLWPIEFVKGFHVQLLPYRYIMRQNWTSEWNVFTIWISR